jgi:hypothetical protein
MASKKRGKPRVEYETSVFEIKEWEPSYTLSVTARKEDPESYSEYIELHLETSCIEPKKFAGRVAGMILSSRRGFHTLKRDFDAGSQLDSIGFLTLRPAGGSFYAGIPQETMEFLAHALAVGKLRYVMLTGSTFVRSESKITSLHMMRTLD